MTDLAWIAAAFCLGAVPFAVLIGGLAAGVDIRKYGDGNPGATNVLRATGSKVWFLLAVNLDICKGLVPVALAYWYGGLSANSAALVGIAAISGHAFSPLLRFDGGKAIATTGGVWMAFTFFESLLPHIFLLVYCFYVLDSSDWTIILGILGFGVYILVSPHRQNEAWWLLWAGSVLLLFFKHRAGFRQRPKLRSNLPFHRP